MHTRPMKAVTPNIITAPQRVPSSPEKSAITSGTSAMIIGGRNARRFSAGIGSAAAFKSTTTAPV